MNPKNGININYHTQITNEDGVYANTLTVSHINSTGGSQPQSRPRTSVRTTNGNIESAGPSTAVASNKFHTHR